MITSSLYWAYVICSLITFGGLVKYLINDSEVTDHIDVAIMLIVMAVASILWPLTWTYCFIMKTKEKQHG